MRQQQAFNDQRRDSKSFVVVDDDCGVPTSVVENYQENNDSGPAGQFDPQSLSLSMSEYDKSQAYSVYSDYNEATRPEAGQDYTGFAAPAPFPDQYVGAQAQVPSGLPQSTVALGLAPSTQPYDTHDQSFYGQQQPQFAAYLDTSSPRRAPEIISYMPNEGPTGTKITVHFQSQYDFDNPQVNVFIMFDGKRCESVLSKRHPQNDMYQYTVSADSPPLLNTNSPLQIPLQLVLDSHSVIWETDTLEFGSFSYLDPPLYYQSTSPDAAPSRKRKLSLNVSPRHSPIKKNMPTVPGVQGQAYLTNTLPIGTPTSPFRRPSAPESFTQNRRFSGNDYQQAYPGAMNQQYFAGGPGSTTPSLRTTQSPSWGYHGGVQSANRSPSTASVSVSVSGKNAQLLPSPAASNPPLIRTSTIQTSPTTPNMAPSIAGFNPYTIYAANSKAQLEIDGELNSMADKWTTVEWESKRRLVQFRRSQSGSTITATFEPVTLEDRIPNSICISCIWWEEKQECYVTSVDTISLLESLVAVRFTVEEKNRIRRNLEGFRPATVSKVKADSEEFFKLIMGFPNPKPRNIEKDVKVFPWRILATALKKIIGKYASHPGPHDA
ncbi:Hypothetical protein R9X50_00063100 [Acrodontium crateriforme]|uniref:DUF7082 domain-containing protein n=1 Tax=Acrodontium crateriforme TaxID=150365 RepID=A0AAQ3LXV3_9PEZI|nr:Hypothetical protein R9X50_00063100 [Acrodontium crateriforme]